MGLRAVEEHPGLGKQRAAHRHSVPFSLPQVARQRPAEPAHRVELDRRQTPFAPHLRQRVDLVVRTQPDQPDQAVVVAVGHRMGMAEMVVDAQQDQAQAAQVVDGVERVVSRSTPLVVAVVVGYLTAALLVETAELVVVAQSAQGSQYQVGLIWAAMAEAHLADRHLAQHLGLAVLQLQQMVLGVVGEVCLTSQTAHYSAAVVVVGITVKLQAGMVGQAVVVVVGHPRWPVPAVVVGSVAEAVLHMAAPAEAADSVVVVPEIILV